MGIGAMLVVALLSSLCLVSNTFVLDTSDAERSVVHQVFVSNGGIWGTWREKQFCPQGTFAKGYRLKIEGPQGDGDDTMTNGITLICAGESGSGGTISSAVGQWGSYVSTATCQGSSQYLVAFQMNVEANQDFGDDTAVNDIRFRCRDYSAGNMTDLDSSPPTPHYGQWGTYSSPVPPTPPSAASVQN